MVTALDTRRTYRERVLLKIKIMTTVYRSLFRRAWTLTWHSKHLWLFGLLSALLMGGGELNVLFRNTERIARLGEWAYMVRAGERGLTAWRLQSLIDLPTGMYVVGVACVLVAGIVLYFALVAQGALIRGIDRERRERQTLSLGLREGKKYVGRIALLTLYYHVGAGAVWAIVCLPPFLLYLAFGSSFWFILFLLIAFVCLVPVALALTLLYRFAMIICVCEDVPVQESVLRALRLARTNWIIMLELAVFLTLGVTAAALVGVSLIVIAVLILFGPLMMFGYVFSAPLVFTASGLAAVIFLLIGVASFGAIVAVFQQTAWVYLYYRVRENPPYAKIVRTLALLALRLKGKK